MKLYSLHRRHYQLAFLIGFLALLVRLIFVRFYPVSPLAGGDPTAYWTFAQGVAAGRGFRSTFESWLADRPPLYSYFLAGLFFSTDLNSMQPLFFWIIHIIVKAAAWLYQAEGINIPLTFMPTQTIAPTLRSYGATIGERVRFRAPLVIHNGALRPQSFYHHLSVGNDCFFGRELFLDLQDRIIIEDNVTVSHRVTILTHTDVGESPLKNGPFPPSQAPVLLRQGAYIGTGAIILPGVEIGECAVVGAGAVVTKDAPAFTVVAGVPARLLRTLQPVNCAKEVT